MIKEAIEKIIDIATPKTYTICDEDYTNDPNMRRIAPHIDRPDSIDLSSLDGIVQAIKTEIDDPEVAKPLFVNVKTPTHVSVFTTFRGDIPCRDELYSAYPDLPHKCDVWMSHEQAIIALRSQFVPDAGTEYLLDLLSRVSSEDSVTSEDNGVSQSVSTAVGVALKGMERVKTRVVLAPFRTFLEVDQPESEFLVRVRPADKERGYPLQIGIIEADGGAWRLAAKRNVAGYFREHLAELVGAGKVIVVE